MCALQNYITIFSINPVPCLSPAARRYLQQDSGHTRLSKLAPYSLGAYFIYYLVKRLEIRLFLLHKYFSKNFFCVIIMVIVVILFGEVSYGVFS